MFNKLILDLENINVKIDGGKDNGNTTIVQDDFDSSDVLVVSNNNSSKE